VLIKPTDPRPAWLLLCTKAKQERAVSAALDGRGIRAYCPRVLEPPRHPRAPVGPVPLFPSYVYWSRRRAGSFPGHALLRGRRGHRALRRLRRGVEDKSIERLREREGKTGHLVSRDVRNAPRQGGRVRILSGPFSGYGGLVKRYLPSQEQIKILLTVVGSTGRVEMASRHVHCV